MGEKVKLSSIAQKELEESSEWYDEQSAGLGFSFAEVIYSSLNSISKNPETFNKRRANKREFIVDKFPFIIIYEYLKKENIIYVLHIFHTSPNPKLKYRRL